MSIEMVNFGKKQIEKDEEIILKIEELLEICNNKLIKEKIMQTISELGIANSKIITRKNYVDKFPIRYINENITNHDLITFQNNLPRKYSKLLTDEEKIERRKYLTRVSDYRIRCGNNARTKVWTNDSDIKC